MPEPKPYGAILREALTDRERNVLLLARGGPLHVARELNLKSEAAADTLIREVKHKAAAAVGKVRDDEAVRAEHELAERARGSSTLGQREPATVGAANGHHPGVVVTPPLGLDDALRAAAAGDSDVPAEEAGMIHEEAAGAGGSPAGDPPPSAPAADSGFDEDDDAPPPLERADDAATDVAVAEGQVREQDAGGYGAREEPDEPDEPEPAEPREHRRQRGRGELREEFLMVVHERGPIRQCEVAQALDVSQSTISHMVAACRDVVDVGPLERRSPLLTIRTGVALPAGPPPAPAEPEPTPAAPAVALPEPVDRWFEYMALLFELARQPRCPEHIFDRIERGLFEGPPPRDVRDRA